MPIPNKSRQPHGALLAIVLAGALMTISPSFAQVSASQPPPVMDMRTKGEFLDRQERISGGAAVGVSFFSAGDQVRADEAFTFFSQPVSSRLEMQLATVDGRYLATFDYDPPEPLFGWVRLNLDLSRPDFLSKYEPHEIALLLTDADTGSAYPVRWGKAEEAEFVRVHVNTEGANSYFVTYDEVRKRFSTRNCQKASARSSFKFDRICDLPVTDVLENNDVSIMRKRGADFGTPIDVTIVYKRAVDR